MLSLFLIFVTSYLLYLSIDDRSIWCNFIILMETPNECTVVSRKRCQSQIAKAWWEKKHAAINESISMREEVIHLRSQLEEARMEVDALRNTKVLLQSSNKSMVSLNKAISAERDSLLTERIG